MKHWMLTALMGMTACAVPPATPGASDPPAASHATSAASLVGTRWIGVVDPGTRDANVPRLEIVAEGRIAGYTGCNVMNATWTMEGGQPHVSRIVATKRMCAGPEGDIEKRLLAALENGRLAKEGDKLVATGAHGERFEFRPAD